MVGLETSSLEGARWRDYAIRFIFGGIVTAGTGLIAKRWGPGVAGLFLAFPAIFPAGATLIEKHEREKKQKAGMDGTARGRAAASVDAAGAAMGTLGLMAFALVVWRAAAWPLELVGFDGCGRCLVRRFGAGVVASQDD